MALDSKHIYAIVALSLVVFSRGVYFNSIFRGHTRPHSFSWLIWAVISSIGFAAQVAEGAGPGAWVRGFGAATCYIIVILGWQRGERNIKRIDWITLGVALLAIPLWIITKTPVWSVLLVCFIDTSGYIPTIRKVWHKPKEETAVGYVISSFGSIFSILAIENYNLSTWLYPLVLGCTNIMMASYILLRRRHLGRLPQNLGLDDEGASLHA